VIADTFEHALNAFNALSKQYQYQPFELSNKESYRTMKTEELMAHIGMRHYQLPFFIKKLRGSLSVTADKWDVCPGMKTILDFLSTQPINLGIVSSNSPENIDRFLKKHKLDIFDFVLADMGMFKKSRVLKKLVKCHQLNHHQVILIGDESRDIQAGKAANINTIGVTWGYHSATNLNACHPDYLIHTPDALKKLMLELN